MKLGKVKAVSFPERLLVEVGSQKRLYLPAAPRDLDGRILMPPECYPEGSDLWHQASHMESPQKGTRQLDGLA